jgi:CheY-like chemotaxis protein
VPTSLLAVDDSATMRRCLEIAFGGDDFEVTTADGKASCMQALAASPQVVVVDTSLGADDGYALAKEIRAKLPTSAIILLSSRHNPFDAAKGQDAGADDHCDKPFETQALIDKAKKVLAARGAGSPISSNAAAPKPAPAAAAQPTAAAQPAQAPTPPAAPPKPAGAAPKPAHTLMFGANNAAPLAAGLQKPAEAKTDRDETKAGIPTPAGTVQAVASLQPKLEGMGLSAAQVTAILALTKDVVEKVVWEVVPPLAEQLIKEEIARITKA